jgi:hypothetical protein
VLDFIHRSHEVGLLLCLCHAASLAPLQRSFPPFFEKQGMLDSLRATDRTATRQIKLPRPSGVISVSVIASAKERNRE